MGLAEWAKRRWRGVNLDLATGAQEVEIAVAPGTDQPARGEALHLLRLILRQNRADEASALHLFYDDEDRCLRMLEYVPVPRDGRPEGWLELVPPPDALGRALLRQVRGRAGLRPGRTSGTLHYRHAGTWRSAACESPRPEDVRIYFAEDRPRVLDKKAGDAPPRRFRGPGSGEEADGRRAQGR
jgi:hypothetical protein